MAGPFTYLGGQEMHYHDYLDGETGKMLVAVPGADPYEVISVDPARFPMPPTDGRWQLAPGAPEPPAPEPPAPAPVLTFDFASEPAPAPEGGDE